MTVKRTEEFKHSKGSTAFSQEASIQGETEEFTNDVGVKLLLRGTFIDVCDNEEDAPPSPRALSDPGSEISSGYSAHFVKERNYVAGLSRQVTKTLLRKKSNGSAQSPTSDSDNSSRPHSTLAGNKEPNFFKPGKSLASSNPSDVRWNQRAGQRSDPMRVSQDELRNLVNKKTAEMNDVLNYQRLSTALTSINEIPEQVGEVLQQSATHLVDEVHDEISVARNLIATSNAGEAHAGAAERAARSIAMVPDMIMASFESSFAKAMSTVRIRVDDMIQDLEGSNMANEKVVEQMWAIPEEVRQITREAVKEASQESRERVVEQLDCVLHNFSEETTMPDALWQAKMQIVAKVPKKLPDTLRAATEAAETNIFQAVKLVQEKGDVSGVVANRVVADTLLRAKVGPSLQGAGAKTLCAQNPGSIGHPELCSRACLYFPLGKCTNGSNCAFCHMTHSKRATHLDKRHREMLRAMDFVERFALMLPILRMKLDSLERGKEVGEALDELDVLVKSREEPGAVPLPNKRRSKETRTLQIALKFMSVRSLLTLLHHTPISEDSPEHIAVTALLQKVRPEFAVVGITDVSTYGPKSSQHSVRDRSNDSQFSD